MLDKRSTLELSKAKSVRVVIEGFLVWEVSHWLGGAYLAVILSKTFPSLPLITVFTISSSALSPVIAIAFMVLRIRFNPKVEITRGTVIAIGVGAFVSWFISSLGRAVFFTGAVPFFHEVTKISTPSYFYFTVFLFIVWGPLLEEAVARGYFFEILKKSWGDTIALLISSFIFVVGHAIWGASALELVFVSLYSIVFTFVYISGGLFAAGLTHIYVNCYLFYISM